MKTIFVLSLVIALSFSAIAQQLNEDAVPANIKKVAAEKNSGEAITSWIKDKTRSKYIASTITESVARVIEIGFDGKWVETTEVVLPEDLPLAVMNSVKREYLNKNYELGNSHRVEKPGKTLVYHLDVSSEDENVQLEIDALGKILERKKD